MTERHAESLLDICHEAGSTPMEMTVSQTENLTLQSISSSEVGGNGGVEREEDMGGGEGGRGGSAVKSVLCIYRGYRISSQHRHDNSQPPITPYPFLIAKDTRHAGSTDIFMQANHLCR